MATKIQIRRDTATNWTAQNPTLSDGEMGFETDTGYMKIGDGTTAWSSLTYLIGAPPGVGGTLYTLPITSTGNNPTITLTGNDSTTDPVQFAAGTGIDLSEDGTIITTSLNAFLSDLSNVAAASPNTGDVLQWSGSTWDSVALSASNVTGLSTVATSGAYADLTGTPTLATVATSGSFTDLSNVPNTLAGTLAALSDTNVGSASSGSILEYTGGSWTSSYGFSAQLEFYQGAIFRRSISHRLEDGYKIRLLGPNGVVSLRDGPYGDTSAGAGVWWIDSVNYDFIANITDADTNLNRSVDYRIIVDNNYIAGSETDIVIIGKRSDPSFSYPLTYTLRTGDGSEYTYQATGEDERNFFAGISALGIPGLTIGFDSDNPDYLNPTQITYTPQYEGDTLQLVEPADVENNPSGWDHLAMTEKVYSLEAGDNGSFRSPGVVITGFRHNNTDVPINWIGGGAPTGGTGRFDIYDIHYYREGSTRYAFIKHSTTTDLGVQMLNGDLTGSVFADDSTLLVDALRGVIVGPVEGNVTGDLTGSVFADDSAKVIDGISGFVTGKLAPATEAAPTLAGDPGETGEIRFDNTNIYLKCPDGNWRKVALAAL